MKLFLKISNKLYFLDLHLSLFSQDISKIILLITHKKINMLLIKSIHSIVITLDLYIIYYKSASVRAVINLVAKGQLISKANFEVFI